MTKRTAMVISMTVTAMLTVVLAWAADYEMDQHTPQRLAYFVVYGGFSIASLITTILIASHLPPRRARGKP